MKYILCHSGKGYYYSYVGPLEEFICICVSPNNKPSQTFVQGKSSPVLRNSVPSIYCIDPNSEFVSKVPFFKSK